MTPPGFGAATDVLTFSAFNVDQAPLNIQNNDMDLYLFGLKTAGAQSLEGNADVRLINAPASTLSLILNSGSCQRRVIQPLLGARSGMRWAAHRPGFHRQRHLSGPRPADADQYQPARLRPADHFPVVSAANITYDLMASQQIGAAMEAAGATLDGNVWTFNGSPVMIKIVTRVEDERRDIGDLVRSTLEGSGSRCSRSTSSSALRRWRCMPATEDVPAAYLHRGLGARGPARYDDAGINQFAAPWLGNMPGWQEVGFWQYENETLDDLGKRLYRGEFASKEERDSLYQEMTGVALDESVRVWLVTALQSPDSHRDREPHRRHRERAPQCLCVTRRRNPGQGRDPVWQPGSGPKERPGTRSPDLATSTAPTSTRTWSILRSSIIHSVACQTRSEPITWSKRPVPTARWMYQRMRLWDAAQDVWTPLGSGVTAKSKVTFDYTKYLQSFWQHGPAITMADVIYPIAQGHEIAFDEAKVQIETAMGITARPLYETFRGYRFGETTVEVYVDYWHFEEGYIAAVCLAFVGVDLWELLAAMDDVVFEKRQGRIPIRQQRDSRCRGSVW